MGRDDDACGGSACLVIAVALNVGVRLDYPPAVAVLSRVALCSLICFASLGSSVTPQYSLQQGRIPTVQLCDLLRSPGRYKNKTVRVRAVYHSWFGGSELMSNCPDDEGGVWAYFPDSVNEPYLTIFARPRRFLGTWQITGCCQKCRNRGATCPLQ